jgi:hypothetical protein
MGKGGRDDPDVASLLHVSVKRDKYLFKIVILTRKINRYAVCGYGAGKALSRGQEQDG